MGDKTYILRESEAPFGFDLSKDVTFTVTGTKERAQVIMALETVAPESLDEGSLSKYTENHKAYVQSWAQSIKDKPDILFKAIKEAEHAADYMDMKAGLLSHLDYLHRYQKGPMPELEGEASDLIIKPPMMLDTQLVTAKALPRKMHM